MKNNAILEGVWGGGGGIGEYRIPQDRKKNWQIPKYCVKNRRNTDTAFIFGHAYLKGVSISRDCLSQAFMHQQSTSAITRKRETTSNSVGSTIEKDALPISS